MTHQPDITRIPTSLLSLEWLPVTPETKWYDGMVVLFAVPVRHRRYLRLDAMQWHYELAIVDISVYENSQGANSMSCEVDGERWGWEPQDADWYVVIRE